MSDKEQFDFWYAVNNTDVLVLPTGTLETFGATSLTYHLLTEPMDSVDQVRVREGRIDAARPEILTPHSFMETPLDGFGPEAAAYIEWLRHNAQDLYILRYGFQIAKRENKEYLLSDSLESVTERVRRTIEEKDSAMTALAVGVDQPWEVCLLKLMVEVVEHSAAGNVRELQSKNLFEEARNDPGGVRRQVEAAFRGAAKDPSRIDALAELLQRHRLFEEYQDRFFRLVRTRP